MEFELKQLKLDDHRILTKIQKITGSSTNILISKLDGHRTLMKFSKMTNIPIKKLDDPGIL